MLSFVASSVAYSTGALPCAEMNHILKSSPLAEAVEKEQIVYPCEISLISSEPGVSVYECKTCKTTITERMI